MPLPNIALAQFNAISNGDYNAGQIDFATGRNGETELVKINNHEVRSPPGHGRPRLPRGRLPR